MVEPVHAKVGDVNIGPAIVVVVSHYDPVTPAIIRYAGLFRDICKRSVVIVMEQRSMRRRLLAIERFDG